MYKFMVTLSVQDVVDALIFALSAPETAQVHDILIRPTGQEGYQVRYVWVYNIIPAKFLKMLRCTCCSWTDIRKFLYE
ncbi:unnamed protein product [Allacma fusca]|uniref:Uncharacterized protein n=1 Tax=Allacma fusca TaxID=39272 RepID=A0A8J2JPR0_9HEXA|nr:unnamed protein product [Allacma fusca]